jgi:hypothetical protein
MPSRPSLQAWRNNVVAGLAWRNNVVAGLLEALVEREAGTGLGSSLASAALRSSSGLRRRSLPQLEQARRQTGNGPVRPPVAQPIERHAVAVAGDRLAVEEARAHLERIHGDEGIAVGQSMPLRVSSCTLAGSRRAIGRKPSCLISCTQPRPDGGRSAGEGKQAG